MPKFSTSGPGNRLSRLLWRLVLPRPVPLYTFAPLATGFNLIIALILGAAVAIYDEDIDWLPAMSAIVGMVATGLLFGLGSTVILDRLRPKFAFGSHSAQTAGSRPYLIYAISGAIGAIFALYMRSIIPVGAFVELEGQVEFTTLLHIAIVSVVVFASTAVGALASMLHEMIEKRKEYEAALEERVNELEASRRRIVIAQETVRREIASHLHGPVQTRLLMLRKNLEECQRITESQPERAIAMFAQVNEELDRLQSEEIRDISHQLHPSIIRLGLPAALRSLCDRFATLVPITLEIKQEVDHLEDPANPLISEDVRLALYRLAEEAMNNVIKHARASQVMLCLRQPNHGQIELSVEDDGIGFVAGTSERGLGISTMQDYISAVGGIFDIQSTLGKGTKVIATVPIKGPGS